MNEFEQPTQCNLKSVLTDEVQFQEWIALIVEQDQPAFNRLLKTASKQVYSLALRITKNVQIAEEVTEDVFFQVWRQAPRFDPERGSAMAWILTIARSRALDALRCIPPFEELTETHQATLHDHSMGGCLTDLILAFEQNQFLHQALCTLDAVPRQLLSLSFFKGLSHEEIAEFTDLPLGTVKSHIRRALNTLEKALIHEQLRITN